ncbi:hypothetical protein [Frigidibacter sp.]|uniref:hypothetical protein n=1 Tax=Frigidibacter sp. TaxID=2586418 RepID=UPI002732D660|nr:hypothetical protein [Frigidibacter sp.]MDP3340271.1 hypothetical protein [Frigidibacter sp.]
MTRPPPVFVLAAPGVPGQTLVAALGRNPGAYDLPECNLELSGTVDNLLREMTGMRQGQLHGLLRSLSHLLVGEQSMASVEMARRWLTRHMHLPTGAVAQRLAAMIAPRRMVAPVTSALFEPGGTERLLATFPDADFVHLQMHPVAQGRAVMGQSGGAAAMLMGAVDDSVSPPMPDAQELWAMAEAGVAVFRAGVAPSRFHALRVEDLAAGPALALAGLAGALALPADAAAVARMLRPEDSAFAGPGPFGAHLAGDVLDLAALRAAVPAAGAVSLKGPLPWRPDGGGLRPALRDQAMAMGYS